MKIKGIIISDDLFYFGTNSLYFEDQTGPTINLSSLAFKY